MPNFTVAAFYVDEIKFCYSRGDNIIGCGTKPGGRIALQSAFAAGENGSSFWRTNWATTWAWTTLVATT